MILASSKSFIVTSIRDLGVCLRSAPIPAKLQIALTSAPDILSWSEKSLFTSTSSARVILLVWTFQIWTWAALSGSGTSIRRSIRPGRISAGSRCETLFVAKMMETCSLGSKPSNRASSSIMVRWTSASPADSVWYLFWPTASISKSYTIKHSFPHFCYINPFFR